MEVIANHEVWSYGLGIASHIAALKPSLVRNINWKDAYDHLKDSFGYLKDSVPNPATNPSVFAPCGVLYPGICRSDQNWGKVNRLVQQFQVGLDNSKSSSCELMKFELRRAESPADSSSTEQTEILSTRWYILGCVSKRPLVHVLGRVEHKVHPKSSYPIWVPRYVSPDDFEKRHWELETGYGLFADLVSESVEAHETNVLVQVFLYPYEAIGSLGMPNHFKPATFARFQFAVGTKVVLARDKEPSQPKPQSVDLGFGISASDPPPVKRKTREHHSHEESDQPSIKTPKLKAKDSATEHRKPKAKKQKTVEAEDSSSRPNVDFDVSEPMDMEKFAAFLESKTTDFSKMSDVEKMAVQQGTDTCGIILNTDMQAELLKVTKLLSGHEFESEMKPDTLLPSAPGKTKVLAKPEFAFAPEVGVVDFQKAKRTMKCLTCDQKIFPGEFRIEHVYHVKKPPRSLHIECAGGIAPDAMPKSIRWLEANLEKWRGHDGADHIHRALDILRPLAACTKPH